MTFCCSFRETGWGHRYSTPHAFLGGLSYLLTQFLPVGTHYVLDVGADQVREYRMSYVVIVRADQEQVNWPSRLSSLL